MKSNRLVLFVALMFLAAAVSCGGGSKKQVKGESGKSGKAGCELCGEATGYAQILTAISHSPATGPSTTP